ncbi:MAG TPA: BamA/TamA family outer membrane protein [Bryobacteraceae bacterium]|jgi:outer membrane protein assembly complex protein YaeT|nr:BamA/TamA family outer membrane protein [Bryobacteraceae bacterium]
MAGFLLLFCTQVVAGNPNPWLIENALRFEGKRITSIGFQNVSSGSAVQPMRDSELSAILPFKPGSIFHEPDLHVALQNLYATGHYLQIAIDAADDADGVALRFLTTTAYFIGHVSINGVNAPPNRGQLFGVAKLRLGTRLDPADTSQAIDSMKDVLRENGFYNARIGSHVTYDPVTSQSAIHFDINTGKRARFERPVITGDNVSTEEIVKVSRWQRLYGLLGWQQVTEERVQNGLDNIRNYYDKRDLLQSQITLTREYNKATNTVKPVIHIDTGSRVAVRVTGAKISAAELKILIPVFQERAIDTELLEEGEQKIEQFLQGEGYFGAEASYSIAKNDDGRTTTITYTVARGQRHRFVYLGISGNRYFSSATLRERMYEIPAQFPRYPTGRFSLTYLHSDEDAIKRLYSANGFPQVKVVTRVVDDLDGVRGHVGVYFTIVEGPQIRIADLSIEGAAPEDLAVLRQALASTRGQPFSGESLALDRENTLNYYYNLGYLAASFQYSVEPGYDANHVRLKYTIASGPRTYVRDVIVSGLQTTKRNLVLRRIELRKDEPLSLLEETDSQRRLYNLGIFARVNTALQNPDGQESYKNVLYDIEEASHYTLNVAAGAQIGRIGGGTTSLDNPAGTTGFAPRIAVGITRENFLGLGQSLSLQTGLSTIEQRAALSWFIPQFVSNPNLSLTSAALIDDTNDIRTYNARRREASLQLGQKLSRAYTLQYRLVFRHVTLSDLKIDPLLVPLLAQPETIGLTEISLIEDKRDDPTDAHRGVYNTVDLSYAPGFLGSQIQFGRALFRNSTYHPFGRSLVFARSTQFGIIEGSGPATNIPLAERLYSGGSNSIRAFPDFQAGPRDLVTGFPLGGNALFINNTELRFPLYGDNLKAVIFHDAGNVYASISEFSVRFRQENLQDFNYMVQDVGIGIRYRTPIGPIRADFSFSPDAPRFFGLKGTEQDYINGTATSTVQKINAFQFHISLGQAF